MARYGKRRRITRTLRNQLLADFAQALVHLNDLRDAAAFIQDLLTEPEAEMLGKRLAIADRLIDGVRYEDIQRELTVSPTTIARVNAWLQTSGQGFRAVRSRRSAPNMRPTRQRRQRLTRYNWPVVLIERLLHRASERERVELEQLFAKLNKKSDLYRDLASYFIPAKD